MKLRTTHTVALMDVSQSTYDEVAGKLRDAGYDHAFLEDGDEVHLDMSGIALVAAAPVPRLNPAVRDRDMRLLRGTTIAGAGAGAIKKFADLLQAERDLIAEDLRAGARLARARGLLAAAVVLEGAAQRAEAAEYLEELSPRGDTEG